MIWLFDLARGSRARFTLGAGPYDRSTWSRDGQHLYFTANPESDRWEIHRKAWDSARRQISASGTQPHWRPDGQELFYLARDGMLMAVDIEATARGLTVGPPRALFSTQVNPMEGTRNSYVVGRGGQRFLFATPVQGSGPPPVTIVLNWAAEHRKEP